MPDAMPWWVLPYLGLLGLAGAFGVGYQRRRAVPVVMLVADTVSTVGLGLLTLGPWLAPTRAAPGPAVLGLMAGVLAWEVASTARQLRMVRTDPTLGGEAPAGAEAVVVVVTAAAYAPAFACGLLWLRLAWP